MELILVFILLSKKMSWMWTISKVVIEFVTTLLLFYVLVSSQRGMWDVSSPTGD